MDDDGSVTGHTLTTLGRPLSLHQVVSTLSGPIREEHAWAILYQGITRLHQVSTGSCFLLGGLSDLLLTGDGRVHKDSFLVEVNLNQKLSKFRPLN